MQLSVESLSKLDTSKNRILIDWFSFSSRIDSFETLASLIGMSSVNWQERCGVRGYSSRFVFEGVTIIEGKEVKGSDTYPVYIVKGYTV